MLNVVAVVYSFYLSRKMFASISEILKLWPAERIIKISSVKRSYFSREEKNETILGYLILDPTRVLGSTYYFFTRMINSPGDKISLSLHFYLIIKERLLQWQSSPPIVPTGEETMRIVLNSVMFYKHSDLAEN